MQKKFLVIYIILSFVILNTFLFSTILFKYMLQKSCIRFHITANSNHIEDQIIKVKLLEYLKRSNNLNKDNLLKETNNFLKENGAKYKAKIQIGNIYFSKRESKNKYMPSSTYPAINIVLGKGYGKNFWTIISENNVNITTSFMPLSTNYNEDITYSFYAIELLEKLKKNSSV